MIEIRDSSAPLPARFATGSLFSPFAQFFANPIWIAPQIEDAENLRLIAVLAIVNAKWETARQHPVKFEVHWMNPA